LTVDFGTVELAGQSPTAMLTVTNIGQDASGTINASLLGSAASVFAIELNDCTTLAGGASCTIGVRPAPTISGALGQVNASLRISASPGGQEPIRRSSRS